MTGTGAEIGAEAGLGPTETEMARREETKNRLEAERSNKTHRRVIDDGQT